MKYHYFLGVVFSILLVFSSSTQTNNHSKKTFICLTYDDGLVSYINSVLPAIGLYRIKSDFLFEIHPGVFRNNQQVFRGRELTETVLPMLEFRQPNSQKIKHLI